MRPRHTTKDFKEVYKICGRIGMIFLSHIITSWQGTSFSIRFPLGSATDKTVTLWLMHSFRKLGPKGLRDTLRIRDQDTLQHLQHMRTECRPDSPHMDPRCHISDTHHTCMINHIGIMHLLARRLTICTTPAAAVRHTTANHQYESTQTLFIVYLNVYKALTTDFTQ